MTQKPIIIFLLGCVAFFAVNVFFIELHRSSLPNDNRNPAETSVSAITDDAPNPEPDQKEARFIDIDSYHIALIREALAQVQFTSGFFTAKPVSENIPSLRIKQEVIQGDMINMFWGPVLPQFNIPELIKINIPLAQGLNGCRILMIRKGTQDQFDSLEKLKKNVFGLGHGWMEIGIFEAAGYTVTTSLNHESLYKSLAEGRFDAIPYGADVVHKHLLASQKITPDLTLEQNFAFSYPSPQMYYVNSKYAELANALEKGLVELHNSGRMDEIFREHHVELVAQLNLEQRTIIPLPNHMLSADAPVIETPCKIPVPILQQ